MAAARFQIVSVAGRAPRVREPQDARFVWRFLSANNRSLATSAPSFPDVASALVSIKELCGQLGDARSVTSRNGNGLWVWRVRVGESDVAMSSRRYQRRVRAALACTSFFDLVGGISQVDAVQVVRF